MLGWTLPSEPLRQPHSSTYRQLGCVWPHAPFGDPPQPSSCPRRYTIRDSGTCCPPFMQNQGQRDPDTIVSSGACPSDRICRVRPSVLHRQAQPPHLYETNTGAIPRQRIRGWTIPEADILSLLRLIDERITSFQIEVQHRDANVALRRSTAPIRVRWCHRNGPDRNSLLWWTQTGVCSPRRERWIRIA